VRAFSIHPLRLHANDGSFFEGVLGTLIWGGGREGREAERRLRHSAHSRRFRLQTRRYTRPFVEVSKEFFGASNYPVLSPLGSRYYSAYRDGETHSYFILMQLAELAPSWA
jgi:hypothetical protein